MNTYNGSLYVLFVDLVTPKTAERGNNANYKPIVCGTSNGVSLEQEGIVFRNKCDNGFEYSVPGYVTWGFDMEGHAIGVKNSEKLIKSNFQELARLLIDKVVFWAKMADVDNQIVREGLVRISSYRETANMEEPYSFTASFVGIGKPIFETDLFLTVLAANITGTELIQDGNNNLIENNDGY